MVSEKKNYLIEYTVDAAILDVKPFDGKTIEVTTNYDITDFDAIAVTITGMEIVSADYADRTVTITTTEDFVAGSEHTVTIDGKTATFTATEKPAAVEVESCFVWL